MNPLPLASTFLLLLILITTPLVSAPEREPTTTVKFVNATAVPAISLTVNKDFTHETFPQGLETGDAAMPWTKMTLKGTDLATGNTRQVEITLEPNTRNTILLLGDFSLTTKPDELAQEDAPPEETPEDQNKPKKPNFFALVFPHVEPSQGSFTYRFINTIPKRNLTLIDLKTQRHPLKPGQMIVLSNQPQSGEYQTEFDGKLNLTPIRQAGTGCNATIFYFIKNNRFTARRAFEITDAYMKMLEAQQAKEAEEPPPATPSPTP